MEDLIIDPEFRDIIPPLTDGEFEQLEKNILADGEVIDPIITWNNTIIDGHNRWKIIEAHPEISYKIKEKEFEDRDEAIVWICMEQRGRRNMTNAAMTLLMAEAAEALRRKAGRKMRFNEAKNCLKNKDNSLANESEQGRAVEKVAKEFDVSPITVYQAEKFRSGVKAAEEISPGFEADIKSGAIKAPKYVIQDLPKAPEEVQVEVISKLNEQKEADSAEEKKKRRNEAREIIRNAWDREKQSEYTLDNFRSSLMKAVDSMDSGLNAQLVQMHADMLETEEGRTVAYEVLDAAEEVIERYRMEVIATYE